MRAAISKLNLLNKKRRVEYFEGLENYKNIRETIIRMKYGQKNFYAALSIQLELVSKMNSRRKRPVPTICGGETKVGIKEIFGSELKIPADPPSGIPVNCQFDQSSFFDFAFPNKKLSKQCFWFRAKDFEPVVRTRASSPSC